MKKEYIYELITNAYKGEQFLNSYVSRFTKELKNEGYFEMAKVITNIKNNHAKVSFASKKDKKDILKLYGMEIYKEVEILDMGYELGITNSILLEGRPGTGKNDICEALSRKNEDTDSWNEVVTNNGCEIWWIN